MLHQRESLQGISNSGETAMTYRTYLLLPTVVTLLSAFQLSPPQGPPDNVVEGRFPKPPTEPWDVFVSYCAKDQRYWKRIKLHLTRLRREGTRIYSHDIVEPGSVIQEEARYALETSVVAVLLISIDYIASDLMENELPDLLEQAEQRGTRMLRLQVGNCNLSGMDRLTKYKRVGARRPPLNRLREPNQDDIYAELTEVIEKTLTVRKRLPKPSTTGTVEET